MHTSTPENNINLKRSENNLKYERLFFTAVFIFFLLLRIISWAHVTQFEEPDSVWYLDIAKIIINNHWNRLTPVDNLFYPFCIVIVNALGFGLEFSARLISLLFSILLFFSIYFLGKKIIGVKSSLITVAILSLSPFYISFSISALSDPSYIGLVFLGFLIFRYFIEKPKISAILITGIIFGLSYTDRTEGIIFLFLIPFFQLLHFFFFKKIKYSFSKYLSYILIYILGFSAAAVPMIIHVSNQMGTFSISGRTAWEKLLKYKEGKSYNEKMYGLDFSKKEVNFEYILTHPHKLDKLTKSESWYVKLKYFVYNVSELYHTQLSTLLGVFIIFFSGIGVYFMFSEKKIMDLSFLLIFIIIVLIPPMWLETFVTRHIVAAGPPFMLLAGFGVYKFSESIKGKLKYYNANASYINFFQNKIPIIFLIIMVILSIGWINKSVRYPTQNDEYKLENFSEPLHAIKEDIQKNNILNPKVVSWHAYFPYFAKVGNIVTPFTDYKGLVKYCKENNADYLFLEYERLKNYPFLINFERGEHPDFKLLSSQTFSNGKKIELYKFLY